MNYALRHLLLASLLLVVPSVASAQTARAAEPAVRPPAPVRSPDVHADRTITFRYRDALAHQAAVAIDVNGATLPMEKDADGVWSVTTPPMPPEIYIYHFAVDGITRADASNPQVVHSLSNLSNMVEVPGNGPQLWDARDVPHGVVHHHQYKTAAVLGLANNESDYFVYTPPGYNATAKKTYPVLYLLHGWGAGASGWTAVGQAQEILDNLLAEGKIKPMVVVMPLGYGDMTFVKDWGVWQRPAEIDHNVALCEKALLTEVMPQVEAQYKVSKKREERAIAGFSMGGLQALSTGLTHTDMFAYVGGFSSAIHALKPDQVFTGLTPATDNLKVLWVACGVDDGLITANRRFIAWLKTKNIPVTQVETPGRHAWPVWRDNFIQFTPLLFGAK
jgi:enterochelin esterase family protein